MEPYYLSAHAVCPQFTAPAHVPRNTPPTHSTVSEVSSYPPVRSLEMMDHRMRAAENTMRNMLRTHIDIVCK